MSDINEEQTTLPGHREGRGELHQWRASMPENAFTSDRHLQRILEVYAREDRADGLFEALERFGAEVAGPIDELVRQNDLRRNHPRLDRFDDYGARIEQIAHHPSYHEAGRLIYGSGIMAAYRHHPNSVGALSRMYVSSTNGEAGHNCPLACTAGVIRVLQELGTDELRDRYLDRFLDPDYERHYEGAQFLTEVQGGSDVGANATRAVQEEDGTWRIWGEKWFCSNIDADVFLMTARPDDAPEGTRGLGLFLVPRVLEDGTTNEFYIRRLKDKIGTRTMASGECDFRGAVAHHMGELGEGFKNMMMLVINTSRLYNAMACAGLARRAYVIAQTYARHRTAFGHTIGDYPLVQETLADMKAELDAMVSGSFYLSELQDRIDAGEADDAEKGFMRMALNLNKVRTAMSARRIAVSGIEVLGGNGAIETFSVLPRLLRDSIVTENWEGTHNTLYMQTLRDMKKYRVHDGFFAVVDRLLGDDLDDAAGGFSELLDEKRKELHLRCARLLDTEDTGDASLQMRELSDDLTSLLYAAVRVHEERSLSEDGEVFGDETERASFAHFLHRRLEAPRSIGELPYRERIATIAESL